MFPKPKLLGTHKSIYLYTTPYNKTLPLNYFLLMETLLCCINMDLTSPVLSAHRTNMLFSN